MTKRGTPDGGRHTTEVTHQRLPPLFIVGKLPHFLRNQIAGPLGPAPGTLFKLHGMMDGVLFVGMHADQFEPVDIEHEPITHYGEMFSSTIKVTTGIVSAMRGLGDDSSQFQMDAAVQPGSSGGPIYDGNGNIVGVVVAQLNKLKFAKLDAPFGNEGKTVVITIVARALGIFLGAQFALVDHTFSLF